MKMPYSDPDKQREYQRKWMQREGRSKPAIGTKRFFYSSCSKLKAKARDNNIEFNLDSKYLQDIFPKDNRCPALEFTFKRGDGKRIDESPTLDRIVPNKGYVKGNVQWVSGLANQIMSSATPDQVVQVGEYFKQVVEKKNAA